VVALSYLKVSSIAELRVNFWKNTSGVHSPHFVFEYQERSPHSSRVQVTSPRDVSCPFIGKSLWSPYDYEVPTKSLWSPYEVPMKSLRSPYEVPMKSLRSPYEVPMTMKSLRSPYEVPTKLIVERTHLEYTAEIQIRRDAFCFWIPRKESAQFKSSSDKCKRCILSFQRTTLLAKEIIRHLKPTAQ